MLDQEKRTKIWLTLACFFRVLNQCEKKLQDEYEKRIENYLVHVMSLRICLKARAYWKIQEKRCMGVL